MSSKCFLSTHYIVSPELGAGVRIEKHKWGWEWGGTFTITGIGKPTPLRFGWITEFLCCI